MAVRTRPAINWFRECMLSRHLDQHIMKVNNRKGHIVTLKKWIKKVAGPAIPEAWMLIFQLLLINIITNPFTR